MEMLSVAEAARSLKVNAMTIRRHIASGEIAVVRVGRLIRIPEDALAEFATPSRAKPHNARRGFGRPFTADDPMWQMVGIGESGDSDVSENKHRYVADAVEHDDA